MTYKQLQDLTIAMIDESVNDEELVQTIKNGINEGYMMVATTIDKQPSVVTFTPSEEGVSLPDDFFNINFVSAGDINLSHNDFFLDGHLLFITNKDYKDSQDLVLHYYKFPERLESDTDIPVVNPAYHSLLAQYGAIEGLIFKKKFEGVSARLNNFMQVLQLGGVKNNELQGDVSLRSRQNRQAGTR